MIFGAHVSVAGGLPNAIHNANLLNIKAIQIFPWSPRMWSPRAISQKEINEYLTLKKESSIKFDVYHMVYLANLAADSSVIYKMSLNALNHTVKLAEKIDAYGTILHLGHNSNRKAGIKKIGNAIYGAIKSTPKSSSHILLENSAGFGNNLGGDFEEIAEIIKAGRGHKRIGVLIDTCHAFAHGYNWKTEAGIQDIRAKIKNSFGFSRIKGLHVNDSKFPLGAGRDRHENIGAGYIGKEGFRKIVKIKELADLPAFLEVPGFDGEGADRKNLDILEALQKPRRMAGER